MSDFNDDPIVFDQGQEPPAELAGLQCRACRVWNEAVRRGTAAELMIVETLLRGAHDSCRGSDEREILFALLSEVSERVSVLRSMRGPEFAGGA